MTEPAIAAPAAALDTSPIASTELTARELLGGYGVGWRPAVDESENYILPGAL